MRMRATIAGAVIALAATGCSADDGTDSSSTTGAGSTGVSTSVSTAAPTSTTAPVSSACSGAVPIAPGAEKVATTSGGVERTYWRAVPTSYESSAAMPLVLDFHGYQEGADIHRVMSDLEGYGEEQGFVVVTPQGLGAIARWDVALDSADLDFVGTLLDEVEAAVCVDLDRVFATGLSNGAMMTSAVACRYADRIAAIAPVAGLQDPADCDPARPLPVLTFHGTADGFVAYEGGLGPDALDLPAPDGSGKTLGESGLLDGVDPGPSVPEILAAWAERNGCDAATEEESIADDVTIVAHDCSAGAETKLYRVEGGGHTWPGSEFSQTIANVVGVTTTSIVANEVMWEFFLAHPRTAIDG